MNQKTAEQIEKFKINVIHPKAVITSTIQSYKILVIFLAAALVLCLTMNYKLVLKEQLIVSVDDQGIPQSLKVNKQKDITEFTSMPIFIRTYLDYLYNWDYRVYSMKCSLIMPLMAPDLRQEFQESIEKNQDAIEKTNTISTISVLSVYNDKLVPYKGGYLTEAKCVKTRIVNQQIDSEVFSTFQIAYRKIKPTVDNIWGYEVFMVTEYKEGDIKGEIK